MKSIAPVLLAFLVGAVGCVRGDELRRQAYDAQYQQALRLCGHPEAAFQAGYNAGFSNEKMHSEWAAMCVASAQSEAHASYQRGFLEGARNAPVTVVHRVQPLPGAHRPAVTTAAQCTFDSDCGGGGYVCRHRECMGNGYVGDRCVFNSDCLNDRCFGGTCRAN
jgi:hypothetical protein